MSLIKVAEQSMAIYSLHLKMSNLENFQIIQWAPNRIIKAGTMFGVNASVCKKSYCSAVSFNVKKTEGKNLQHWKAATLKDVQG